MGALFLRREGWHVNKKRVHGLWRKQGLKVPLKQRKKRRLSDNGENGCARQQAQYVNHVWSYDFVMDWTDDGRRLKSAGVYQGVPVHRGRADHHRRGCRKDPSNPVQAARRTHLHPFGQRPGFIAKAVKRWLTLYVEPGSPWENAYSEKTFISRFRDELPKREVFATRLEAKVLVEEYRNHYNQERPHSTLSYRTPAGFAAGCELDNVDEDITKELESVITLS
jgi:putative transposase